MTDSESLGQGVRPIFYCPECNTGFEVALKRCPFCRHRRKGIAKARLADKMRKKLSKSARNLIFLRDGHRCLACGSPRNLTIDHIVPLSKGGTNEAGNLQTLCAGCNNRVKRGKTTDYRGERAVACGP